jgi:histidinol-phosphatase
VSSASELRGLLAFAHELVDETDVTALRHFVGELTITAKHDRTLVTQADTEVERRLRDRIAAAYPTHAVTGEEFGADAGGGEWRWVIDPIDATHNFVRGIPVFATLLALARSDEIVLGVVSAPALGDRWSAVAGGGAFVRRGGEELPIRVSEIRQLSDAQLCYSTLRGLDRAGLGPGVRRAVQAAWRDRGFGDFWGHMLVAQGSAEAMLEYGVAPWDMAAPYAVVTQAGGLMTDLAGQPSWQAAQVLTSNGRVHDELLEMLVSG